MRLAISLVLLGLVSLAQEAAPPKPPPSPDAFSQPRRLMDQGQYDAAITQLQDLQSHDAQLKGVSRELGTAYYKKGDYVKAIASLQKALAQDPEDKESVQLLGLSNYLSGRPADAIPLL